MLGLREQIGRDHDGIAVSSASTRISLGPAMPSMSTSPNTSRLAHVTYDVARPDDLVDARKRRRAVRERRDGLRAARVEDARDAREVRRREHDDRRGAGVASTMSRTPATRAGIAAMSTLDGYRALPPGA